MRLLAAPYLVIGIGAITIDVSGPLNDLVICQAVDLRPSGDATAAVAAARDCENSQVPGHRLKPRLAAEATRCLIDKQRRAHGLRALDAQRTLKKAAKRHNEQMLSSSCFSHTCPGEPDLVGQGHLGGLPALQLQLERR